MRNTAAPPDVGENRKLYWTLWCCGLAIIGVLLITAKSMYGILLFKVGPVELDWGLTALEFAAFYTILSFKMAPADTNAGAYCYGKALARLGSGPHFVPRGLMQLATRSRLVQEFQCPGEPEKVFKGHDNENLPTNMVRPIRVVTREPKPDEKGILDVQMTLIASFVVQYVINDVFDFNANFGSTEQVEKQVRDIGEIIIAEVASDTTPAGFIKGLPGTNETLIGELRSRLDHLGINVISVRMISPDVSREVSAELARIPIESAKAQQKVIQAGAEKVRLTDEGAGRASAEKAMLGARTTGYQEMAAGLKVSGTEVLAAETAGSLVNAGTVVIGAGGGMQDLMGVVKAAQTALQPNGGTKS